MLKKFAVWFIVFGLSFGLANVLNWTEQGKTFFYIYLGSSILIILIEIVRLLIVDGTKKAKKEAGISAFSAISTIIIIVFTTWCAAKLFNVDFFVAYQIMSFGQCL